MFKWLKALMPNQSPVPKSVHNTPPRPVASVPITPPVDGTLPMSHRLSESERVRVVELLAQFNPPGAVVEYVRKEFGKVISHQALESYRSSARWAPLFEKVRQDYLTRISDVAIANKRVRLEKLEQMCAEVAEDKTIKYADKRRAEIRACLREARYETEVAKGQETNVAVLNITTLSNEDLEKRRKELMRQLMDKGEVVDAVR